MAGQFINCETPQAWEQWLASVTENNDLCVVYFHGHFFHLSVDLANKISTDLVPKWPNVHFLSVNSNPCKTIAQKYNATELPTIVFMKQGIEIGRMDNITGVLSLVNKKTFSSEYVRELVPKPQNYPFHEVVTLDEKLAEIETRLSSL